jgi:hypothetical protein
MKRASRKRGLFLLLDLLTPYHYNKRKQEIREGNGIMPDIDVKVNSEEANNDNGEFSAEPSEPMPTPAAEPEPVAPHHHEEPPIEHHDPVSSPSFTDKPGSPKMPNKNLLVTGGLVLVIVILAIWGLSLSSSNSKLKKDNSDLKNQVAQLNANPQAIIQKQTNDLISKVSKLMQLPTGETPTVAEVSDAAAAKKQSAFFNNAQNGDKVLMYVNAHEAILYRPATNKIILVAPLTFSSNTATSTTSTTKH